MARETVLETNDEAIETSAWLPDLMVATGFLSVWISALYVRSGQSLSVIDALRNGRERVSDFFPGTDWSALEGETLEA